LLNVLLDVLLILVIGLGVEGAGIATLLSQLFSALLCVIYIRKHLQVLIPTRSERAYQDKMVGRLLNAGIPMGLQFSITAIGSIMLRSAYNSLGTICATAFTAGMRIKMCCICPFENVGVAMATYCGQNLGAARRFAENAANYLVRIRRGVFCALEGMIVYAAFMILVLRLFSRQISTLFIYASETEILDCSEQFLCVSCVFYPVLGTLCILRYSLQGLGYTSLSMFSGFNEMIARVGVSLFVVPWLGFYGVCIGDPTAWIAAVMFLIPAFIIIYKRLYSFCVEK
jgi:Na+-driven multidrug efflux pump